MRVDVSRLHFPVTTLGPGRRAGLWFQGCSIRCPGCISVDTWQNGVGSVTTDMVIQQLSLVSGDAEGLTVSGGEPLDQGDALAEILAAWRGMSSRSVLVFTGRKWGEAQAWIELHPHLIDAIVTEPFRSDLPQTLALRGSDNQELHLLSQLGEEFRVYDRPADASDRRLDVMFDEAGDAWFAGIPGRGDIARLRRALADAGHRSTTSETTGAFTA